MAIEEQREPNDALRWECRQVVMDLYERPHLLTMIEMTGACFPPMALEPFVTVGKVRSRFVRIAEDSRTARAYFDRSLPPEGEIEFGYGHEVLHRLPRRFTDDSIERLDLARLPEGTVGPAADSAERSTRRASER
jgi:hypothetical protein